LPNSGSYSNILVPALTFDTQKAQLVMHVINNSDLDYTNVIVQGSLLDGEAIDLRNTSISPSQGTYQTRLLNPGSLEALFNSPTSSKQVSWYVGNIPAHSEATLTMNIPLLTAAYGKTITGAWTAKFGGGSPTDQKIGGIVLK
jgi:hypothetical protein